MTALYIILGLLAAFIVITLIRAAFFTAPKPQREEFPPEQVNGQRACDRLSQAIQIKTISCEDESQTDWGAFDRFHAFLEQSYPLIHKNLKLDHISTASLLFYWEGTDPDLDPIAFLAHQDVVPISEGTEEDWEHPAFDGVNDGRFIWGRGALDMKNHLICLMESVETLLEEGYTPKRGVPLFYQTSLIPSRIRTGSRSSASRLTVSCASLNRLCPVRTFCDILLETRRSKIHTAILNILHIRDQAVVTGGIQRCYADS